MARKTPYPDLRFKGVKLLLENNTIKSFAGIFKVIPKSVVAQAIDCSPTRITNMIVYPGKISFMEISKMADVFDVDFRLLLHVIIADFEQIQAAIDFTNQSPE